MEDASDDENMNNGSGDSSEDEKLKLDNRSDDKDVNDRPDDEDVDDRPDDENVYGLSDDEYFSMM